MARRAKGAAKGKALARRAVSRPSKGPSGATLSRAVPRGLSAGEVGTYREVFWQNVVRDILVELAMLCSLKPRGEAKGERKGAEKHAERHGEDEVVYDAALFDGRMGVVLQSGERISIAHVQLLLAAGAVGIEDRAIAMAVDSTVFQITTPEGHLLTVPVQQVRAFHAVSPELMEQLQKRAARASRGPRARRENEVVPFGFAAFTSLARGESPDGEKPSELPATPATADPLE